LSAAGYGYAVYLMMPGTERLLRTPKSSSMQFAAASVAAIGIGVVILHRLLSAVIGGPAPL
jgi:hypothetical protein